MLDFLAIAYPWTKFLHIISVISWMAGIFYLPRLYVYHSEQEMDEKTDQLFQTMERRLLRGIMNPAMIATWVFGVALVLTPGIVVWGDIWPWTKGACVIAMTVFHHWLANRRKDFARGENKLPGRTYRMMNEVPTLLMVLIVASVVVKF